MISRDEEKRAENEAAFRDANERIRVDGMTFAILRRHRSDGEVIEEHDSYVVVRKTHAGGEAARALHPRGEGA